MRACINCKKPITLGSYCKDLICQQVFAEIKKKKAKKRYLKSYKKIQKFCPGCKKDVTGLWPNRTCGKKKCKEIWEQKKIQKQIDRQEVYSKTHKYPRRKCKICGRIKRQNEDGRAHTCSNASCKKKWQTAQKKRHQKKERLRWHKRKAQQDLKQKELQYIEDNKTPENLEHIDKIIDKLNKPNGRHCQKCNKVLFGNYHWTCPICLKTVEDEEPEVANSGYW
jgi:hypothetical protein